jgi:hypothetical protein
MWTRVRLLHSAVKLIAESPFDARGSDEALLLSIAVSAMINGLTQHGNQTEFDRRIFHSCGRRQISVDPEPTHDFAGLSRYIGRSHGMFFLCDVRLDLAMAHRALRLPRAAAMTFGPRHIRPAFGGHDWDVLEAMQPSPNPPVDAILWAPLA